MISQAQKDNIVMMVQNCLVYEGQCTIFSFLKEHDLFARQQHAEAYELARKNAGESGKQLLMFLNSITKPEGGFSEDN